MATLRSTTRPSAGRVLAVASVLPALLLAGWILAGLPLLLAGGFHALPAVLLAVPLMAALCWAALRRPVAAVEATARQVAAVFAVAAASGVFNAVFHSEQLIVRRDPATYAQYAIWIAGHGSLPIPFQEAAFGGPDPALVFGSVGFFEQPEGVVPQFMPGSPLLLALGEWLDVLLLTPALMGALAVVVVAGLTARLAGARWAALAGLTFAVAIPVLYTSRTTFSEIPSLVLLFGGMILLHEALSARPRALGAGLAGLVFGCAVLVRIDGLRDVLPVLAFAGLLIALSRVRRARAQGPSGGLREGLGRSGAALLLGLAAGVALAFLVAYLLARPYLTYLSRSVVPLLGICAAVLLLTALGALLAPRLARLRLPARLPDLAAALVGLLMLGLAVRPWLQTVRRTPVTEEDRLTYEFLKRLDGDGTRLYFEDSLWWVIWYVGPVTVVLATLAAAVLVRRLLRGGSRWQEWLLPLALIGWTTVTTLLRPEITPDQPWASRRLVPVVLPGLILLGAWGLAWLRGRTTRSWPIAVAAVLLFLPGAVVSIGTAFTPVERGEQAAVESMCSRIPADASVLIVERVTGDRFTQVVRGQCGVPAAQVRRPEGADIPPEAEVRRLIDRVRAAGRVPVVLAAEESQVSAFGTAEQVMALVTRQDERSLTSPPNGTWGLTVNVWMGRPG
ncbi:hypothetical protein [Nonomuraea soli]|uniref:Glycosyltransferase RgtA/B/C/D-like domain-containing protein n=1 Tax=Nonomuraea soli TaxID=1032476 RepID=A0A7W0CK98_9ACTN|nr:hypothetical protein [Nonomuraea soli]MBA2892619.1 hypothetical protein [Nonomuraea soli]